MKNIKVIKIVNPIRNKNSWVFLLTGRPKIFSKQKNIIWPPSKTGIGKRLIRPKDIEINAQELEYQKTSGILEAYKKGSISIFSKNLEIEFDYAIIDEINSTINANGNVKVFKKDKGVMMEANSIEYNQNSSEIKADEDVIIRLSKQNL